MMGEGLVSPGLEEVSVGVTDRPREDVLREDPTELPSVTGMMEIWGEGALVLSPPPPALCCAAWCCC